MGKKMIFLGLGIIMATILTWNNNTVTDAEIIQRARELGMLFPEEVNIDFNSQSEENSIKFVSIAIPNGASGEQIANILTEHGFNGAKFLMEATNRGIISNIKFGNYDIPRDATIEEIINIMSN